MVSGRSFATLLASIATLGSTHFVVQKYYADSTDCSGSYSVSDGISGDKGCFATSVGFESEDIQCDEDNMAMHVTLYTNSGCSSSQVLNAFSIASGSCHVQPSIGGSFSWSCSSARPSPYAPTPTPPSSASWVNLGQGCCHNVQSLPIYYKLYDTNAPDCQAKCEQFGSSCGYATTWGPGQWCTVLRNDAPCSSLDAGDGQCGSSGAGAVTYKHMLPFTSLPKVTKGPYSTVSWTPEGQGCCHNTPSLPTYYKLFDGNLDANEDCRAKCLEFGTNCGYATTWGQGQWCTVLRNDAPCYSLDAGPGQCGSSGVGAFTYKLEYTSLQKVTANNSANSTASTGSWQPEGQGCCHNSPGLPIYYKLFDNNAPDCQATCEQFGSSCGYITTWGPGQWCTVWRADTPCYSLDPGPGQCGSSGVGAYTYKHTLPLTSLPKVTANSTKGPYSTVSWIPEGQGCCHNTPSLPTYYKLFDANLAANEDCRAKCLEFGTSCGYATTWGQGQWCTVLRNDAPCYSLDAGPGQCGSSGVGAFTYKLEYTSLQKVTANSTANSTASTGSLEPEGQGCCHNAQGLPIYYKLFDDNAPDCQAKCEQFGSSCGYITTWGPGQWCTVWRAGTPCSSLDSGPGQCGSSGVGAYTYKHISLLTSLPKVTADSTKGPYSTVSWTPEGQGCCHNTPGLPTYYKLFDANLAANEDCRAKCLEFGTSCGYATTWGQGQWCTVLRNDAPCYSLDAGPGQCGSSGVGAFTYKLEYTSLQQVTANNSANSTASTGSWQPEGQGCCHNSPGLPIYYKLFDGNAPDCQMKCEQFGPSCGYITSWGPGQWCTVWRAGTPCSSLDAGVGECGSSGVGAYTWQYNPGPLQDATAKNIVMV